MESTEEGARSFAHFVQHLADGDANAELSDQLHTLARKLREESAKRSSPMKGSLVVSIDLCVEENGMVDVTWAAKTKEPAPKRSRGVMFLTRGGNLTTENPRQQKLPLREVGARNEPAREVAGGKGEV